MANIKEFLEKNITPGSVLPPLLPMIHTTEKFLFVQNIAKENRLKTGKKDGFSEGNLCLYYGRPAYVVGHEVDSRTDDFYYPISLLIEPTNIEKAELVTIYPFDSGAFKSKKEDIKKYIHERMELEHFQIGKDLNILPKLVAVFFGDNEAYCSGKIKPGLIFDSDNDILTACYNILGAEGESSLDERKYSSEIQLAKDFEIQAYDIKAVVLPNSLLKDSFIQKKIISDWKAIPLGYFTCKSDKPGEYRTAIFNKVMEYYTDKGLI